MLFLLYDSATHRFLGGRRDVSPGEADEGNEESFSTGREKLLSEPSWFFQDFLCLNAF